MAEPRMQCITRAQFTVEIHASRPFDGSMTMAEVDRISRKEAEDEIQRRLEEISNWKMVGEMKIIYVTHEVAP